MENKKGVSLNEILEIMRKEGTSLDEIMGEALEKVPALSNERKADSLTSN